MFCYLNKSAPVLLGYPDGAGMLLSELGDCLDRDHVPVVGRHEAEHLKYKLIIVGTV